MKVLELLQEIPLAFTYASAVELLGAKISAASDVELEELLFVAFGLSTTMACYFAPETEVLGALTVLRLAYDRRERQSTSRQKQARRWIRVARYDVCGDQNVFILVRARHCEVVVGILVSAIYGVIVHHFILLVLRYGAKVLAHRRSRAEAEAGVLPHEVVARMRAERLIVDLVAKGRIVNFACHGIQI